ncbi:MAG: hypothetical protein NTW86_24690 [Candidatus Sumerlaeota bacterium]|nr:hypothetical protein [Candidatus Sumerlaeota bacterium]
MRQRILVILALASAVGAAAFMALRLGKGSQTLRVTSISSAYRLYDYLQQTEITGKAADYSSTRQVHCQLVFRGRTRQGVGQFSAQMIPANIEVLINGTRDDKATPNLYNAMAKDAAARPIYNGRPDLYPLDMLNAAEFFPLLQNRSAEPGTEWENQFRVVLPEGPQMVVVARTRFEDIALIGPEEHSRLGYTTHGEAIYPTPDGKGSEKAILDVQGTSIWQPKLGVPYSLEQEMRLRTLDLDQIRTFHLKPGSEELAATKSLRRTRVHLKLLSVTNPKEEQLYRRTPTPVQREREEDVM